MNSDERAFLREVRDTVKRLKIENHALKGKVALLSDRNRSLTKRLELANHRVRVLEDAELERLKREWRETV